MDPTHVSRRQLLPLGQFGAGFENDGEEDYVGGVIA